MGRTKTYDRDTLIARSMELFRDHGYQGTSTQMLVDWLGVNRYGFAPGAYGSRFCRTAHVAVRHWARTRGGDSP